MAATLYDTLVSQGVAPSDTYNVQGQLYNKLGAPNGAYSGTAQQNLFILGKLGGQHYNDILGGGGGGNNTSGSPPGGSSGGSGGSIIPSYDTNIQDYYQTAIGLLKPAEDAQIAPIQQAQSLLPGVYQQKQTALQQNITDEQAMAEQQKKEVQDQQTQGQQQIGSANMAQQGAARAQAAASGITESSGIERSQEANIQNQANLQTTNLATNVANKLADLGLSETHDINQIQQQIANLPNEEAIDSLNYASQIAGIQAGTYKDAMSMAESMLSTAADQAYKEFEASMKVADYQLAQDRLTETINHYNAMEGIQSMRLSLSESKAAAGSQAQQKEDAISAMSSALGQKANSYGNVDYKTYNALRSKWISAGLNAKDFDSNFQSYADPNRQDNKYAGVKYKPIKDPVTGKVTGYSMF